MPDLDQAIDFALSCDPAVPGAGRLCQELLAVALQTAVSRPPAPPAERLNRIAAHCMAPWTDERRAKHRDTCIRKRQARMGR
jgi:hypothetical protein